MKEHNIPRLDLTTINPEARENIETIGHDLAVFDDFGGVPVFEYPSRINLAVLSLCLSGEASASINLKEYTFRTNDMLILMPGQIVQRHGESDDFTGCAFAISTDFVKNSLLGIQQFLLINGIQYGLAQRQIIRTCSLVRHVEKQGQTVGDI